MANKKESTVEDKLRALYDLQLIDSRVDEIRNVRGELPLEVQDLEDEVLGLKTRMDKLKTDVETINFEITAKKNLGPLRAKNKPFFLILRYPSKL